MTVSELSERSIFKGQRILYLGSIKATVSNIYSDGKRISSAYFSSKTKPIFRSESAKYVIFIQMSREMWDFDAEGSGEIMFNKVINGFLPDLFKRWQKLNVRHLVSIVLFTRLEYKKGILKQPDEDRNSRYERRKSTDDSEQDFRDYYRVVTTEAHSGKWVEILYRLRREFLVFLKDVSVIGGDKTYGRPPETLAAVKAVTDVESVIAGQPTTAAKGNILEAINLASSQFTRDYVDRDLVRTGLSLAIITAGTGVFEVDYNMLKLTTDSLVASGMGVDLVSLARMPLHSVPLFRYRSPHVVHALSAHSTLQEHSPFHAGSTPRQSTFAANASGGATLRPGGNFSYRSTGNSDDAPFGTQMESGVQWSYALPHWIDVSFWTGHTDEAMIRIQHGSTASSRNSHGKTKRPFTTSCRMYELQMMGLMETEMRNIAIDLLPEHIRPVKDQHAEKSPYLYNIETGLVESGLSNSVGSTRSFLDTHMETPRNVGDLSQGTAPSRRDLKELGDLMNMYDQDMFKEPVSPVTTILDHAVLEPGRTGISAGTRYSQSPTRVRNSLVPSPSLLKASHRSVYDADISSPDEHADRTNQELTVKQANQAKPATKKRAPMPRQISLGPRGLGTVKSAASTSISVEGAVDLRSPIRETSTKQFPPTQQAAPSKFSSLTQQLLNTLTRKPSQASLAKSIKSGDGDESSVAESSAYAQRSTPIAIKDHMNETDRESGAITVRHASVPKSDDIVLKNASIIGRQSGPRADSFSVAAADRADVHKTISPLTAMSPWLTMLNPSNPKKHNMSIASQFRRWQHVFPKAIPTSAIKWKSLCSPAALPLTAEYFPTPEELQNDYHEYTYKIMPIDDDEQSQAPRTRDALIRELISCRLSHGFQIVIGSAADEFVGSNAASLVQAFDKSYMTEDGATVLMTIGNHLHQLLCTVDGEVEIRRYMRKPVAAVESVGAVHPSVTYHPYIRTFLAAEYELRPVVFKNPRPTYYWNAIDHHLAGYQEEYSPDLRYWCARFVLIPVDPKLRSGQLGFVSENSDEEIRLEGIQKLTQLWQRHRYIPPEERKNHLSLQQRSKDPNPLAIEYQTRDPSQMVRSHAAGLTETLLAGEPGHELFAEAEQYHTSVIDKQKLSQHLQADPPRGVPLADRRWHLRTHHRCFRGDHLTSWLISNFKDIQTREEAVKLGEALMREGLFTHVMQKHQFRDGNYFYQIASDYSTVPDVKQSWFGTGRSIPSTPMFEGPKDSPKLRPWESPKLRPKDSPKLRPRDTSKMNSVDTVRSRSSADTSRTTSDDSLPKKRPKIELSRALRYDVDGRKRSYRPEIINLHYDRIHNPENCYHIRIDWMNVTAKLIEDAITSWASSVERYGLRLVELPIAEGVALLEKHPFRRPYEIKLCVPPPKNRPVDDTDSMTSQTQEEIRESHPYSRALLRKFDFVLDMEAASSFDASVDVTYSWGKPDYRYTQFIHKSGGLIIQINDAGNFTLCANRLCVDRSIAAREAGKFDKNERPERRKPASMDTLSDPEIIKDRLEQVCHDPEKLQEFYDHAFSKEKSPQSPSPPYTPVLDANIPSFGLPPTIMLRSASHLDTPRSAMAARRASTHGVPKSTD